MDVKKIGNTEIDVTRVSFGCASIGNLYRKISDEDAQDILQEAWNNGIRYFDTAPHYGRGLAEKRLAAFIGSKRRKDFVVSTKVGRLLSPCEPLAEADGFVEPLPNAVTYDYSAEGIQKSFEQSCERLGLDTIDILYVHDLGKFTHGDNAEKYMTQFLNDGYDQLVRLKESGKIGAFGLGVNENEVCLQVMDHGPLDVILLAGRLTLLDRSAEAELVPRCLASGTSLVLGGIFNSGILATGPIEGATYDYGPASESVLAQVTELKTQVEAVGMSLVGAAMRFAHDHSAVASILFGTAKSSSLVRNLTTLEATPSKLIEPFLK
jgi:D-threo-aldose 1-dehydrogenase